jgi:hypothetical protein
MPVPGWSAFRERIAIGRIQHGVQQGQQCIDRRLSSASSSFAATRKILFGPT